MVLQSMRSSAKRREVDKSFISSALTRTVVTRGESNSQHGREGREGKNLGGTEQTTNQREPPFSNRGLLFFGAQGTL